MRNIIKLIICILILISVNCEMKKSTSSIPFDLPEPTLKPSIFAAQHISITGADERDICISSTGDEIYFSRNANIMVVKKVGKTWGEATAAEFSSEFPEFEAQLTPDGNSVYFISRRPLSGTGEAEDWQIWYSKRQETSWLEPLRFNDKMDFYPTFTTNGYMYFTDAQNDIYRIAFSNNQTGDREKLPEVINTYQAEYNAFIASDESYLIYTSHNQSGELGGGDLYINFRNEDGSWGSVRHMGPGVNSPTLDYCPYVSPDGKYFFFSSRRTGEEDIYWVDAQIIDDLRSVDLDCITGLMAELDQVVLSQAMEYYQAFIVKNADYADYDGSILNSLKNRLLENGQIEQAQATLNYYINEYPDYQHWLSALEKAILTNSLVTINAVYDTLVARRSELPQNFEQQVNSLGYRYLRFRSILLARAIFKLNTQLFPNSFNVFDSYGEILLASGDTIRALSNYRKSLELNPENTNAENILKQLNFESRSLPE